MVRVAEFGDEEAAVEIALDVLLQGADLKTALLAAAHDTGVPERRIFAALKSRKRIKALMGSLVSDPRRGRGGSKGRAQGAFPG